MRTKKVLVALKLVLLSMRWSSLAATGDKTSQSIEHDLDIEIRPDLKFWTMLVHLSTAVCLRI